LKGILDNKNKSGLYKMLDNNLVSIVVPTFNRTFTFERAINSLISQKYTNIQVIIVNDNFDIEVKDFIRNSVSNYQNKFPNFNIKYIESDKNLGSAKARNLGILSSHGEYITFLDDDDLYLPEKISTQLKVMLQDDSDFSITDQIIYNSEEKIIESRIRKITYTNNQLFLIKYHLLHHLTGTNTLMFKRDFLIKIGLFDPINFGDEFYLIMKAIEFKGKLSYISGSNVKAYVSDDLIGLSNSLKRIQGEINLFKFKKKYFLYLKINERNYVRMRFSLVKAFIYFKSNKLLYSLFNLSIAFLSHPIGLVKIILKRKIN